MGRGVTARGLNSSYLIWHPLDPQKTQEPWPYQTGGEGLLPLHSASILSISSLLLGSHRALQQVRPPISPSKSKKHFASTFKRFFFFFNFWKRLKCGQMIFEQGNMDNRAFKNRPLGVPLFRLSG